MCIFCQIVSKQIPANIVAESEQFLAFKDITPQAPVHVLIITKEHIKSFSEINNYSLMAHLTKFVQKIAKDMNLAKGYRLLTNVGAAGGQSVEHLHFHLLGGRAMGWPPG